MDVFQIVNTGIALLALVMSIVSLFSSWKSNSLQNRVNALEMKLKTKELEERERVEQARQKVRLSANVIRAGKGSCRLRIANIGDIPAYNVHFKLATNQECSWLFQHENEPFEVLSPGSSYDEMVLMIDSMPSKYSIDLVWEDEQGIEHSEQTIITL